MVSREPSPSTCSVTSGQSHTPGPWFRSGMRQKVGGADTHSVIATVDGKEIIVASVWYDRETHEGFRDANLIAAAPDLLEACLSAENWLESWASAEPYLSIIRAAIKKATHCE